MSPPFCYYLPEMPRPGPCCYACGQNFHQTYILLACLTPTCGTQTHEQTRCTVVPRSQKSLALRCPTHGGPGPPATNQTLYYSCYLPLWPGTRPPACIAQDCTNLAHIAKRCSGLIAPPEQSLCIYLRNFTETVPRVSASLLTLHDHPGNRNRIFCGGSPPISDRSSVTTVTSPTTESAPALPRRSQHYQQLRPLGLPSVSFHCCTSTIPISL